MKPDRKLSRRDFLHVSVMAAGGVVLAACGGNTSEPKAEQTSGPNAARKPAAQQSPGQLQFNPPPTAAATQASGAPLGGATQPVSGTVQGGAMQTTASPLPMPKQFKESPMLKEMVSSGKLPKLDERLPKNPMVLQPLDGVGSYGGTWHMVITKGTKAMLWTTIAYEPLVRWKPDTKNFTVDDVMPNIAEKFEIGNDGAEYTFVLREGVKWSDGKPFSADDIMFWYEDVWMNDELTPSRSTRLIPGDNPVKVEKKDDHTVVFRFKKPNGLFLQRLSQPSSVVTMYPAHYMKQFHKKYNPKVVQEAKKQNMESWTDLFGEKFARWSWANKDKPVLFGWKLTSAFGENTTQVVAERNPYYWKVDTEGNQLPYLDKAVYTLVQNDQVGLLKALNGEVDMQGGADSAGAFFTTLQNKPVFYKNRQKGNFRFYNTTPSKMNTGVIALNLTIRDKVKNKVFNERDFRIGLSYAINRQEIIDTVYQRQGEPWQAAPRPESIFHNQKLAKQYTEYSVDKANEHLDKVLPKKNPNGIRLGPDGKPLFIQVEIAGDVKADTVDVMELVQRYWREVGVDMKVKNENRDLFYTRKAGNEPDATLWGGDGGLAVLLEPRWYFPYSSESNFAIPWATWFDNPKDQHAIKPPAPARKQMQLYRQLQTTADSRQQVDLMKQILDIARQQFWVMGISLLPSSYGIVKNNFHNVPDKMLGSWLYPTPGPVNPPQFFFEGKQ